MTNAEINGAYLTYRHMHNDKGNIDNLSPLMHYFLMDCSYQVYCAEIQHLALTQLSAKHRSRIRKGFHDFFSSVHLAFTPEQLDYLLDKVDSFQKYIHNSIERCKVAVLDCFATGAFNERLLASNIWLMNALAADAAGYMECCYLTSSGKPQQDVNINAVIVGSKSLAKCLCRCGESVEQSKADILQKNVSALAKDICKWVYKDYQQNQKES